MLEARSLHTLCQLQDAELLVTGLCKRCSVLGRLSGQLVMLLLLQDPFGVGVWQPLHRPQITTGMMDLLTTSRVGHGHAGLLTCARAEQMIRAAGF